MDGFYIVIRSGRRKTESEIIIEILLFSPIDGQLVWSAGMENDQREVKR